MYSLSQAKEKKLGITCGKNHDMSIPRRSRSIVLAQELDQKSLKSPQLYDMAHL